MMTKRNPRRITAKGIPLFIDEKPSELSETGGNIIRGIECRTEKDEASDQFRLCDNLEIKASLNLGECFEG